MRALSVQVRLPPRYDSHPLAGCPLLPSRCEPWLVLMSCGGTPFRRVQRGRAPSHVDPGPANFCQVAISDDFRSCGGYYGSVRKGKLRSKQGKVLIKPSDSAAKGDVLWNPGEPRFCSSTARAIRYLRRLGFEKGMGVVAPRPANPSPIFAGLGIVSRG